MEKALTITTHHLELSAAAQEMIRARALRLEHFYPELVGCSVLVEGPGRHHQRGGPFNVQIDLRVPGGEPLVVTRQNEDELRIAVRRAFEAAGRQLEDFARIQRAEVKRHEPQSRGRIVRLFPAKGYGFIATFETPSREVYFHRHSLPAGDFSELAVGREVSFHEEAGDRGPQASTVWIEE